MLKNYAGKKILQIMGKTTVDFISIASSIYHCFFFLDLPLVMSGDVPVWSQGACSRLPEIYCLWLTPSIVNLLTLHSAVRLKHHRVGQSPTWGPGYCFLLGCCFSEGSCCPMGNDSVPGSWWLLSQFSPQSHCSQSLLKHLQSILPPFFARAVGK